MLPSAAAAAWAVRRLVAARLMRSGSVTTRIAASRFSTRLYRFQCVFARDAFIAVWTRAPIVQFTRAQPAQTINISMLRATPVFNIE